MRRLPLLALLVLAPLAARAQDSDPDPSIDDSGLEIAAPADDGSHVMGGDFSDAALGLSLPSPGPDWLRIAPVKGSATIAAAFLHPNGDKIRAVIAVAVDRKANNKDLAGYAKQTWTTLAALPIGFSVDQKNTVKIGGRDAFVLDYSQSNKRRKYSQLYLPLPAGGIAVVTFQAPAPIFEKEVGAFRGMAKSIQFVKKR